MRCVICDRPLTVAALTVPTKAGPLVFGPKCARKAMPATKPRQSKPEVQRDPATVDWVQEAAA